MTDRTQAAIDALGRALDDPSGKLKQEVDVAERAIAELRDCLIAQLRQAADAPEADGARRLLNEVNVALSLVVGVEYPSGSMQRESLKSARDVLRRAVPGTS